MSLMGKKKENIDGCPKDTVKKHVKRVDSMIKFYDKMVGLSVEDRKSIGVVNSILKEHIDELSSNGCSKNDEL